MAEENSSPQTPPRKKVSLSSGSKKASPNYLRASTGSCHDFCKYGRKHAIEENTRHPFPGRVAAKSTDGQVSVDSTASFGKKKPLPTVGKVKSSPDLNMTRSLDGLIFVGGEKKKLPLAKLECEKPGVKERSSSAKRSTSVNPKSVGSRVAVSRRSSFGGVDSFNKKNESLKKTVSSSLTTTNDQAVAKPARDAKVKISPEASGKKVVASRVAVSRRSSFGGFDSSNKKNQSLKKVVSSLLNTTKDHVEAKPAQNAKLSISLDEKSGKKVVASIDAPKKVLRRSSLGGGGFDSLNKTKKSLKKVVSPSLNTTNDHVKAEPAHDVDRGVEEKTLYVIKTETADNIQDQSEILAKEESVLEWDQSESFAQEVEYVYKIETEDSTTFELDNTERHVDKVSSTSEFDQSEIRDVAVDSLPNSSSLSDNTPSLANEYGAEGDEEFIYTMSEYENDAYSENSEAESTENSEKKAHKRSNEDEQAWKMRFRRGTIVDIKPEEGGPTRLRFRRGRLLGSQDVGPDGRRRRFKRREESGDEIAGNDAEKVVLKHQDVRGRKDEQGLFNNVIEETASKLVVARKSKVKALVGAFETVISLQDRKPSSNTTET